jgi:integrase/recombinase XerD
MTTTEAVEKFLAGYFGTNTRSSKTRSAYTIDLSQFRSFMNDEMPLQSIQPENLEAWARHMQSRPYASASIRRKFAAARVFFAYWVRRGAIDSSPMWKLRLSLGKTHALPRSLSPTETSLLIEQTWRRNSRSEHGSGASSHTRFMQIRNLAIVETLFATGMRVGEVVKLRLTDWRPDDTCFLVRGKGARERLAFLPDERSLKTVTAYVERRRKRQVSTDALFLNSAGRGISEQGISLLLANIARSAQISRKVTPHMIRHTVATLLLRYGADVRVVQEVLGHASISTTQRYVHVAKDHLLATLRVRHPNHHLNVVLPSEHLAFR